MVKKYTIDISRVIVLCLALVLLVAPAIAASTQVQIIKYANDGTTVLNQTTVTYQWMMANLPVLGDGTTHYYHQGPVFVDNTNETLEQELRWNPAEDTNVDTKDMGAVKGTNIKDLCDLVGGMSVGEQVRILSVDGWSDVFDYKNIYQYSSREGPLGICWYKDGNYPDTGYSEGMRMIWFADTSVNPTGLHAFGNFDWHEAAAPEYWYYYQSGGEKYPTTTGLSGQYVNRIYIYSDDPVPVAPVAVFSGTPLSGNAPLTVQFTDASTGTITGYAWDFNNDGTTDSTAQSPSYQYTAAGTYTVKLTVTGPGGSDDETRTNYITVNEVIPAPVAAFSGTPQSGNAPLTVQFTDASTGSITGYAWDFNNDGTTDSTAQSPSYQYTTAGTYTVKLTVTGPGGSDDETKTNYVTVTSAPVAPVAVFSADPQSGNAPLTVHFTDASTGTAPLSYEWDFNNDGTTDSTVQSPSFIYTATGTYTVNLTVTNEVGSDSEVKTDHIVVSEAPPLPVLNVNTGIRYATIQAAVTAATAGNEILVSDGSYTENVVIDKSIIIRSENGAATTTVTAADSLVPVFDVNAADFVTIDGFSVRGATGSNIGGIDFTDSDSGMITHNDVGSGFNGIHLGGSSTNNTVSDNNCHDNSKRGLSIRNTAYGNFAFRNTFSANTDKDICIKDTTHDNVIWLNNVLGGTLDIGTANTENSPAPITYTYGGSTYTSYLGNYYSTYAGTDADGNGVGDTAFTSGSYWSDSYPLMGQFANYVETTLPPAPVAVFTADVTSGTAPLTVNFTDQSTNTPTSWAWDFTNDGTVDSTTQSPSHIYDTAGTYTVNLTVTNAGGSDSEVKTDYISVQSPGGGSITVILPDDADNCLLESSPDATGDINPYFYAYSRSGGMNRRGLIHFDLSSLPPGATVNSANLYLYMDSLKGEYQLHDMHRVNDPWTEATVSWAKLPAFESIPTASANTGTVAKTWMSWDVSSDVQAFMSGTPNNGWLLKHSVESLDPSQYAKYWTKEYETTSLRPYLEVTYTAGGPAAPNAAFSADMTAGDAPLTVQFTDASTGTPTSWAWDINNDGSVDYTTQNATHIFTTAGNYTVNLTVTNAGGNDSEVKTDYITVNASSVTPALLWGPYLTGTTTTGTVVNVKMNITTAVTVEYATDAYYTANSAYDQSATDSVSTQLHHVSLAGLTPDTLYHYRVVYDGQATGDLHFSTFPASGAFTFVVYSDTQDQLPTFSQLERHKLVADRIAEEPDVAFVLNSGDLVNDASDLANWDRYFAAGSMMMANTTVYPALGNHDNNDPNYYQNYGVPEYYSFDCGDGHVAVLDSNDWAWSAFPTQSAWLANDLQTGKEFKFVSFHHPLYTSESNHFGGWTNLKEEWEDDFNDNGVLAIFNGHVHAYERFLFNDTNYFVAGIGGGPSYNLATPRYTGSLNSLEYMIGYTKVTVDPAAGTATAQVIRVADVSSDLKSITTLYPAGTVFETVVMNLAAAPVANFTATPLTGTAPLAVQFTDTSTGTPISWAWDFNNDGITDNTTQSPSYTYATAGTFTVNLTVTNAKGSDSEVKTGYISVSATPAITELFNGTVTLTPGETFTKQAYNNVTGIYTVNRTTPLGALDVAASTAGFTYDVTDKNYETSGLLLDNIGTYLYQKTPRKSWYAYVNDVYKDGYNNKPNALNVIELSDGDRVEFYYVNGTVADATNLAAVKANASVAVKTVASTGVTPTDWSIVLNGAKTQTVTKTYFEQGLACPSSGHQVNWTDFDGNVWSGVPLWLLVGMIDDNPDVGPDHFNFNDSIAAQGYSVKISSGDNWNTTLASADIARNDGYIVANTLNGEPLPINLTSGKLSWPLHLKGSAVFGGQQVGNITKIELTGLPQPPAGWTLTLQGDVTDVITQSYFEEAIACHHNVTWTDTSGNTWEGVSLWDLAGVVDDFETTSHYTFNDTRATMGYTIRVSAGDGFNATFASADVAHNDGYFLAHKMNGVALTGSAAPLRLVGPSTTSGSQRIGNVVKISLEGLPDQYPPGDWQLTLNGKIIDVIPQGEFEYWALHHPATYTDTNGNVYTGIPLWRLMGWVDDQIPHGSNGFNDAAATAGYTVIVKAGDGYAKEFTSQQIGKTDAFIVANTMNGSSLPAAGDHPPYPLRLVGSGATGGNSVGNIVEIQLTDFLTPVEAPKLHIVKYGSDGTTIINETTIDYHYMEDNLQVIGDGVTHYQYQGVTFDPTDLWDPTETKGMNPPKIDNAIKGTKVKDLVELVGGMGTGTDIILVASDGYETVMGYSNIYTNPYVQSHQGDAVLAWYADGQYVPQYGDGMRFMFTPEDHVFGQWDMHEAMDQKYWHYYWSDNIQYPSAAGTSAKYITEIKIYSSPESDWQLELDGSDIGGIKTNISKTYLEQALACQFGSEHKATYTDSKGNAWEGMPLWFFAGFVDDADQHSNNAFNESLASTGYQVIITAGDGHNATIESPLIIRSSNYIVANSLNGSHIAETDSNWPLRLTGVNATGSSAVKNITSIRLVKNLPLVPIANFSSDVQTGTVPLKVNFTDLSTGLGPLTYAWDFDNDGITDDTTQNPSYTYATAGTYTVNLTVTNAAGSDSEVKAGYVSGTSEPIIDEWSITLNGAGNEQLTRANFESLAESNRLTYTDAKGTWSGIALWRLLARVDDSDPATFSDALATLGYTVNVSAPNFAATIPSQILVRNDTWIVADTLNGTPLPKQISGKNYWPLKIVGPGLSGKQLVGNISMITLENLPSAPVAAFSSDVLTGTAPLKVNFTDQSTGMGQLTYAWDFTNDGITDSTEQSPTYIYTAAGTYSVNLTVTNAGGSDSEVKTTYITVTAAPVAPVAAFSSDLQTGTSPLTVKFTDASTGTPTSWAWDFTNDGISRFHRAKPEPYLRYCRHLHGEPHRYECGWQ